MVNSIYPQERGFKDTLLNYFNTAPASEEASVPVKKPHDSAKKPDYSPFEYRKGDWYNYVTSPGGQFPDFTAKTALYQSGDDVNVYTFGHMNLNMRYGQSFFTDKKYMEHWSDKPKSNVIQDGFYPEQELLFHMEGKIGQRMTVYIDHDSRRLENKYLMQYRAVRDDEVIREINAGDIEVKFDHSKYAVYDSNSVKGMGMDITVRKDDLQVKAFGCITRSEVVIENFRGNSSPGNYKLSEFQYVKRTYYQLEPFKRYDGLTAPPSGPGAYSLVTFTSAPPVPDTYLPCTVNIDPSGFALYIDHQDPLRPYNRYNTIHLSTIDGGHYTKLQAGTDYSINFTTGVITFITAITEKARIFAAYTLNGGTTNSSDPAAILPANSAHPGGEFSGKMIVFIKYGPSINEDTVTKNLVLDLPAETDKNNDGVANLDIYEIRSVYSIGDKNILSNNFYLQFFRENELCTITEKKSIGKYAVDYANGLIQFSTREPFKPLLALQASQRIYDEMQYENIYEYSQFSLKIDYYRDARSFKLRNFNILQNSVKIKINDRVINESLYSVDCTAGFITFTDPGNPVITPETQIEIRYEYLPLGSQTQSFIGGVRADYNLNKSLRVGGSLLMSRASSTEIVPQIGNEPAQTLITEADTSLHLDGKNIAGILNTLPGKRRSSLPLEINAYAEYAKSYKNINSFGKAMIDNMESADELVYISLSENDWILSSMPSGASQADRGILNYYFYRDLSDPDDLRGASYSARKIPYATKPGPYNVSAGHIPSGLEKNVTQRSLVYDFEFSGASQYVSVATRKLADKAVDFSGVQYVEISYLYEGTANIDLNFDIGRINEDADGDGILGTEDVNHNGTLDYDPRTGSSEDVGFAFNGNNPTKIGGGPRLSRLTNGNGVLDSEDLNGNGILDTVEKTYSIQTTLDSMDTGWKKKRIYIDQKNLTDNDIDTLKQTEAVRLYLKGAAGQTGRVYIDDIKFVASKWRNLRTDTGPATPANINVTIVNSISDSDYRAHSFMASEKNEYRNLYGERTSSELKQEQESAIEISYNVTGTYVSATRRFGKPLDLRFYRTLNAWFNYRSFSPGDRIGMVFGSSDYDYIEYRFDMDFQNSWREIKLRLNRGSHGDIDKYGITGSPDLKRIKYMRIIVYAPGHAGSFWMDEIYASEADTVEDTAHWYEAELKITKPFFKTDRGTPVFSDFSVKYIRKGHGSQFSTIGQTATEMAEEYNEVFSSMKILPNWTSNVSFVDEQTETESLNELVNEEKRGKSGRDTFFIESDYLSDIDAVPSAVVSYKYDALGNNKKEAITAEPVNTRTRRVIHTPSVNLLENINDFLFGKLSSRLTMSMFFKGEEIDRSSGTLSAGALAAIVPLKEKEKRQRTDTMLQMNYQNKIFRLQPVLSINSEEIVEMSGKQYTGNAEILSPVSGDYHFPFIYNDDFKFVERNKKTGVIAGLDSSFLIAPEYSLELQYFENRFRDYDTALAHDPSFDRSKNATSLITTGISIPLNLHKIKNLEFAKQMTLSYKRSVNFMESGVPYEGESRNYLDERYGIRKTFAGISGAGMNIFSYYPLYFLFGRGNFANGRDYIREKLNGRMQYPDGSAVSDYNNQLGLIENINLSSIFEFKKFTVDSGMGINELCDRQNIYGIPREIITRTLNINFNFDLMKAFSFWFFRPNMEGLPYHSSFLTLGFIYNNNMLITSNIEENTYTPVLGLNFKWDRSSLGFRYGIEFRYKNDREYISYDGGRRDEKDDIYMANMPAKASFRQNDTGHTFSALYETDIVWLYNFFGEFYKLAAYPIFSVEYQMKINRYDYTVAVSSEPYDLFMLIGKLTLDLHQNIQGAFTSRLALENFRSIETEHLRRQIISYDFGFSFILLF